MYSILNSIFQLVHQIPRSPDENLTFQIKSAYPTFVVAVLVA